MKTEEQLSTSNQKIITPNKELIGVKKSKKKGSYGWDNRYDKDEL